jgi:hypothetical protein
MSPRSEGSFKFVLGGSDMDELSSAVVKEKFGTGQISKAE